MALAEFALHLPKRPVEHLLSPGDDDDAVAHLLGLLHDMRGEQHGPPAPGDFHDHIPHDLTVHGIEAGERFVQNDQFRLVLKRAGKLYLLLHALGELGHLPHGPLSQSEAFQPLPGTSASVPSRKALRLSEEGQLIQHAHLGIQSPLLGQVPDPGREVPTGSLTAEQHDAAFVGRDDAKQHPDRRGLSGTVGPEQAEDAASGHLNGEVPNGRMTRVSLGHVVDGDD
jgi:hypothetical protein